MRIDVGQLEFIDKKLRTMVKWLEKEVGVEFVITSLYRIGDKGVHGALPVRGMDLRMRNVEVGGEIERLVNAYWTYDPKRYHISCAMLHGQGSNLHLHLQTHPNTIKS